MLVVSRAFDDMAEKAKQDCLWGIIDGTNLNADEKATYEWQLWVPEFGEAGQEKLKGVVRRWSKQGRGDYEDLANTGLH